MHIDDLLRTMVERKSSDLHLKVGVPPIIRVNGRLLPLENMERLSPEELQGMVFEVLNEQQKEKFLATHELDMSYSVPGLARFRANVCQQRGTVRLVIRQVPFRIPTFEDLLLPAKVLQYLASQPYGMVL